MRHMKTINVPATQKEVLICTSCDICGDKITSVSGEVSEVDVSYRSGVSYPDVSFGHIVTVDMCSKCFESKLVPWLREQGAVPRTEEY